MILFGRSVKGNRSSLSFDELMGEIANSVAEAHVGVFILPDSKEHIAQHEGSIAKYEGRVQAKWMVIDFDSANVDELIVPITELVEYLDDKNIRYFLFFSGSKGFHLYTRIEHFGFDEKYKDKMHIVCKKIAETLEVLFPKLGATKSIDMQLYSPVHTIRCPFTRHPKGQSFKNLVTLTKTPEGNSEFIKADLDKNGKIAVMTALFNPSEIEIPYKLFNVEITEKDLKETEIKDLSVEGVPFGQPYCIYQMRKLSNVNQRYNHAMRLASHYANSFKFNPPEVYHLLKYWNANLERKLDDEELKHAVDGGYRYSYGCNDSIKLQHCCKDNRCLLWKSTQSTSFKTTEEQLAEYNDYMMVDPSNHLYLGKAFRGLDLHVREAQIVTLFAESGIGKTLALIRIILNTTRPVYLWSIEQPRTEIIGRMYQMLRLNPSNAQDRLLLKKRIEHIYIEEEAFTLNELPERIKAIERLQGRVFDVIGIDFVQYVTANDNDGKYIRDETSMIVFYSKFVKAYLKKTKKKLLQVSQIVKLATGDGNVMLIQSDVKGGTPIINGSDYMISFWRDHKRRKGLRDDVFTLFVCKGRHGYEDVKISYKWLPDILEFGDTIHPEDYVNELSRV